MPISIPATSRKRASSARRGAVMRGDCWDSACVPGGGVEQSFGILRWSADHGFTRLARSAEHGFTLLEMLVALAIFSLAGLALVRLQAVSVRTAGDLDARLLAQITARNIALERMTDPNPPANGESEGEISNAGQSFHWKQVVASTGDKRLMQVTVTVTAGASQSPAVFSIARPAT